MNYYIAAGQRSGTVSVPASKSYAHRLLISAALSESAGTVVCHGISEDIIATIRCLNSLGARIDISNGDMIRVDPIIKQTAEPKNLYCGESGSTLRFILPVVGALGEQAVFHTEGRLSNRPLDDLSNVLTSHGMQISRTENGLSCHGNLTSGEYRIPGNVSSQYISGLLFALPMLKGDSIIAVTDNIESSDYIAMTEDVIRKSGIRFEKENSRYMIPGNQRYKAPDTACVERDWSGAAFFLCMGALSEKGITLSDLSQSSLQGDKRILRVLEQFGAKISILHGEVTVFKNKLIGQTIDASDIPDLVPTISALAACAQGTTKITNARRLRFKESDRIKTTADMLKALGADVEETEDGLLIHGRPYLNGGTVDAANDHRIAMAAAVAAAACVNDVIVNGADCVSKSYPDFWKAIETLEVSK